MRRPVLGFGVIAVLVIAIWAAVASGNDDAPPATTTGVTVPSTSTSAVPSTTEAEMTTSSQTSVTTSTTVTSTVDPEVRVEEVRLILQDLYYRWFDAIYRNDEEAVRAVIATGRNLEAFRNAVESMDLPSAPEKDQIRILNVEILQETDVCLVAFARLDLTEWRGEGATTEGVDVLLRHEGKWKFGTAWKYKNDLWEGDCDLEPDL